MKEGKTEDPHEKESSEPIWRRSPTSKRRAEASSWKREGRTAEEALAEHEPSAEGNGSGAAHSGAIFQPQLTHILSSRNSPANPSPYTHARATPNPTLKSTPNPSPHANPPTYLPLHICSAHILMTVAATKWLENSSPACSFCKHINNDSHKTIFTHKA